MTAIAPVQPPEDAPRTSLPEHIVLYDGVCGLCARAVRFLMSRDADGALWFAPLQGATAARLRERYPGIPADLSTVVYIDGERVHVRSKAFTHVARHLTRPARWLHHLRWVPAWLGDLAYRLIARVRYRVWGRYDSCQRPTDDATARLLP